MQILCRCKLERGLRSLILLLEVTSLGWSQLDDRREQNGGLLIADSVILRHKSTLRSLAIMESGSRDANGRWDREQYLSYQPSVQLLEQLNLDEVVLTIPYKLFATCWQQVSHLKESYITVTSF